jgi:hypothetical protein
MLLLSRPAEAQYQSKPWYHAMQFAKTNPEVAPMTVYLLSILHPSFFEAEINDHLSNHGRHEIDKNVARV